MLYCLWSTWFLNSVFRSVFYLKMEYQQQVQKKKLEIICVLGVFSLLTVFVNMIGPVVIKTHFILEMFAHLIENEL